MTAINNQIEELQKANDIVTAVRRLPWCTTAAVPYLDIPQGLEPWGCLKNVAKEVGYINELLAAKRSMDAVGVRYSYDGQGRPDGATLVHTHQAVGCLSGHCQTWQEAVTRVEHHTQQAGINYRYLQRRAERAETRARLSPNKRNRLRHAKAVKPLFDALMLVEEAATEASSLRMVEMCNSYRA